MFPPFQELQHGRCMFLFGAFTRLFDDVKVDFILLYRDISLNGFRWNFSMRLLEG